MSDRYRGSQLRIMRSCHFAYGQQYVDNVQPLPNRALTGGGNIHDAIAEAAKAFVETGMLNVHEVAFRACRGGNLEYADALRVLTRFQEALGIEFTIDPEKVFLIEEMLEMELQLPNSEVVEFFGTPDLVERLGKHSARITDWKTHWQPENEEAFMADPQLPRYALLLNAKYPALKEFELVKRFIRYENNFRSRVITIDELQTVRLELITEIMIEREIRRAGVYKATPGDWCAFCSYTHTCPVIRKYRAHGVDDLSIDDDDRARELAGDVIALDAFGRQMKERLKVYLGRDHKTGYVPVSGGTYGFGPVEHRDVPAPKLIDVLRENSIEPTYELFNTDTKALDRLLKRVPDKVTHDVEKITLRHTSSECMFRKTPKAAVATGVDEEEALL